MQRQTQIAGVRKWFGSDWIKLQNEIYKAIEQGLLGDLPNLIISGCQVDGTVGNYTVSEGIVLIDNVLHFSPEVVGTSLPLYLAADSQTVQKPYADSLDKITEIHYIADSSTDNPGGSYLKIKVSDSAKILKPYLQDNGTLSGLPTSGLLNVDSNDILATAKAAKLLNDAVTAINLILATASKQGSGYFLFTNNLGQNQYQTPETIEFEISSGTLPSGANHMLFRSGATYVIDVVSGSFGSNGLIMTINGITNINLVNGRNRYTYNGGTTAGVVFKFSNDLSVIEIEVKEYQ